MVLMVVNGKENIGFVDDADDLVAIEHGELRDVVEPHARIGDVQGVVGLDGVVVMIGVTPHDQVAQVAKAFALDEALVDHPVIVVHLRQVLVAAVGHEGDDALGLGLIAAVAQCCGDQGAGRRPRQHAFL